MNKELINGDMKTEEQQQENSFVEPIFDPMFFGVGGGGGALAYFVIVFFVNSSGEMKHPLPHFKKEHYRKDMFVLSSATCC